MIITRNNELPKQMMADFFAKHWGTPEMARDGDFQRHFSL